MKTQPGNVAATLGHYSGTLEYFFKTLRGQTMQAALVIGTVTATKKHASLRGQKLLVVQPQMADGQTADGDPLVAVDRVGAGPGERVMITSDGRSAREFIGIDKTPIRWTTVGICDE